jgi:hypothetical protein
VRDDIRDITELNTTRTDELSHKLSTHLHLSDLRNKSAIDGRSPRARQQGGESVAQQVSDSTGQQGALLLLLWEMTETAAKREQERQQQLGQIQEQWSESAKEIHRGHTMLQNATVRRQDELSAQVLALVQAISALTVSVEGMQQDVIHRVQEQLLRPAPRSIEAKKLEENEMLVQTSREQLHMDHRPLTSDLEAKGKEQESIRIKLKAFARVARKLHQKAAFHGLCKAVYLQKATDFDWKASKSAPPRGLDILQTPWHFSRLCRAQEAVSAGPEG